MASGLGPTGMQITLTPEVVVPDTSPLIHLAAVGQLPSTQGPALVVYENGRVPRMIRREGLSNVVVVATTRAILTFAEQQGLIRSAEATWQAISTRAPGANPELQTRIIRPTSRPSGS
jgi:hypothetical protein